MHLRDQVHEVFCCVFLDSKNRVICVEDLFFGSLNSAHIYPREVLKKVLEHNAAAVIFAHNHPSGNPEPSEADKNITQHLRDALALIDVRVLDHIVIGDTAVSFEQRGLL
jgi:DNA repair protein RadC